MSKKTKHLKQGKQCNLLSWDEDLPPWDGELSSWRWEPDLPTWEELPGWGGKFIEDEIPEYNLPKWEDIVQDWEFTPWEWEDELPDWDKI